MSRFVFWRDRLWLLSCAAYALNRLLLKPHFAAPFLHAHFNDLLLIPAALPPVLWIQERFQLRTRGSTPSGREVAFHLLVWSILFEWLGPHIVRHATGDPLDVVAYCIGGAAAWLWWNRALFTLPKSQPGAA